MSRGRSRSLLGIVALAAITVILATAPFWATKLGRQIDWLRVERVEVSGTRLLAPHEVLATSGIQLGQHLLDETVTWEDALRAHPVIADARVIRRPPHTLRVRIIEKEPVALVSDGELRLATSAGDVLPVDPFAVPLDLPVVQGTLADSASAERTLAALAEVERLNRLAPDIMRDVSEVRGESSGRAVLLRLADAEIVLPVGLSVARLEELRRVLRDVRQRFPRDDGAPTQFHHIDLRFADQVVVRPSSGAERS